MATTHPNPVRQGVADYVTGLLDGGSANPAALLQLQTSGGSGVSDHDMTAPGSGGAFGAANSSGTAAANAIADDANATGGTVARFQGQDRDRTVIIQGDAGGIGSGQELELSVTNIPAGARVQIASWSYTAMP